MSGGGLTIWSPEHLRRPTNAAASGGAWREDDAEGEDGRGGHPQVRRLTVKPMEVSVRHGKTGVDGGELGKPAAGVGTAARLDGLGPFWLA